MWACDAGGSGTGPRLPGTNESQTSAMYVPRAVRGGTANERAVPNTLPASEAVAPTRRAVLASQCHTAHIASKRSLVTHLDPPSAPASHLALWAAAAWLCLSRSATLRCVQSAPVHVQTAWHCDSSCCHCHSKCQRPRHRHCQLGGGTCHCLCHCHCLHHLRRKVLWQTPLLHHWRHHRLLGGWLQPGAQHCLQQAPWKQPVQCARGGR